MTAISSVQQLTSIRNLRDNLNHVLMGKGDVVDQILVAVFAGGNILLDDVPGVGKTTIAKALAKSIDASFHRIQFTPDLLPADIVGGSIFNPNTGEFTFRDGPVFSNILLADEINRASPRTQSALLQAMTEGVVSIEGVERPLAPPFIVIATQNPIEYHGTYPLPEAQLDRFMVSLDIGYPDADTELDMVFAQQKRHPLESVSPVLSCADVCAIQTAARDVGVERSVGRYLVDIVRWSRTDNRLRLGTSPRAAIMLFRACQALALISERDYVTPDDVRKLAVPVLAHRVAVNAQTQYSNHEKSGFIREAVASVAVPI